MNKSPKEKVNNYNNSVGFVGLLQIAFIVLKLCKLIDWKWIWVLAPIWIGLSLLVVILLIIFLYVYIDSKITTKKYFKNFKHIEEIENKKEK